MRAQIAVGVAYAVALAASLFAFFSIDEEGLKWLPRGCILLLAIMYGRSQKYRLIAASVALVLSMAALLRQ